MNAALETITGSASRRRAFRLLALLAAVILVILIADTAARIVWQVTTDTPTVTAAPARGDVAMNGRTDRQQNIGASVAAMQLLGPAASREQAREIPKDAPRTRLNLSLRGLFHSEQQDRALAIIAADGSDEDLYRVGDRLSGGVTIDAIDVDRVVLLRNGRHEILTLPEERIELAHAAPELPDIDEPEAATNGDGDGNLGDTRRQLLRNPGSMARFVQMEPETDGDRFVGFRLSPGEEQGLMEQAGLQDGDIVTALDGTMLDSPEAGMRALRSAARSDQVELQILRDGAPQTLTIDFTQ